MTTSGESKISYLLIGVVLGAVGGLSAASLVRKETREIIRERSRKSLDYLNEQVGKLRESADVIVQQGKNSSRATVPMPLRPLPKPKSRPTRKTGGKTWEAKSFRTCFRNCLKNTRDYRPYAQLLSASSNLKKI
jgi:hypothetical protein